MLSAGRVSDRGYRRNLKRGEFCAVSRDLPNALCHDWVEGWFIPGVSPIKTCMMHREVLVDVATGLRLPVDNRMSGRLSHPYFLKLPLKALPHRWNITFPCLGNTRCNA
ncbi:MAG: hypothetical protein ACJ8LM_03425, partial [Candidatus Udaeobacter sp.]